MNRLGLGNAHYFENNNHKRDEIKQLLDHSGYKEKMEGMKRLLAMMSKGTDVSALYPDVVKNVVCKNLVVKKLVYMYIVHYAELEPDPALLAINNFQRDMQSENQLIRALGLRVMSSFRLRVIVQVVVLAVKKGAKDSSPYVRKAAAHAIPKLYSLDEEQLPDLIEILIGLLRDHSTMVLGSALMAFNAICPERYELLHPHFRKLCQLLADVDEWGQVMILNTLARYGRTQFLNPDIENKQVPTKKKASSSWLGGHSSDSDSESSEEEAADNFSATTDMDPDHRLLLQSVLPLFRSRNTAVILAAAALYYYLAPAAEAQIAGRPLTRILRTSREVQHVVLANIASMATTRPAMFEPYLLEFFVNSTDAAFIRKLKLEILTCIATEANIGTILEELNSYVHREDKELVTASIQAIGRCASRLTEVTDRCMRTLMTLISNRSEEVVAESVVVIKKLLQTGAKQRFPLEQVVAQLARLLPEVTVPKARASIIWVIGEYQRHAPLLGPDILRNLAKSFVDEADIVKLQVLNLGSKLVLTNPSQTRQLFEYVLELAKFDLNYDIRDRARLMRTVLLGSGALHEHAQRLFAAQKPAPVASTPKDEQGHRFALGSLSHAVSHRVHGYVPIPDFPEAAPETDRTPEDAVHAAVVEDVTLDLGRPSSSSSSDEDWSSRSASSSDSESDDRSPRRDRRRRSSSDGGSSFSSASSYDSDSYSSDSEQDGEAPAPRKDQSASTSRQGLESLGLLDFSPAQTLPVSGSGPLALQPVAPIPAGRSLFPGAGDGWAASAVELPKLLLLSNVSGGGLQVEYRFVRSPSIRGPQYNSIQLYLSNHLSEPIHSIHIGKTEGEAEVVPFSEVSLLQPGASLQSIISVVFPSISQPARFQIVTDRGVFHVALKPQPGELLRPNPLSEAEFDSLQRQLGGMHEVAEDVEVEAKSRESLVRAVLQNLHVATVSSSGEALKFAGAGILDKAALLVTLHTTPTAVQIKVNGENALLADMLATTLKKAIQG